MAIFSLRTVHLRRPLDEEIFLARKGAAFYGSGYPSADHTLVPRRRRTGLQVLFIEIPLALGMALVGSTLANTDAVLVSVRVGLNPNLSARQARCKPAPNAPNSH